MTRKRSRSRGSGGTTSSVLRNLAIAVVVIAMASLVVQSAAFDTFQGSRNTDVDTAGDGNALVGIDLPDTVPIGGGGGPGSCIFGSNVLNVTEDDDDDIDTTLDVVVLDEVELDITTTGSVRIESGGRVDGDIDAGGCVIVENGARAQGSIDADGDVTLKSGSRADEDVDAGGDVTLEAGSRIDGDLDAGGDVTLRSGTRVAGSVDADGDVTLRSGARVDGDVSAGGTVTVESGAQVGGDVTEGGAGPSSYPRLVTIANNQGGSLAVTISLIDPGDGVLVIDGNSVGNTATISILEGGARTVFIDPAAGAGSDIAFRIEATNTADSTVVTLERSVPTVLNDGGDGGDIGDDQDDSGDGGDIGDDQDDSGDEADAGDDNGDDGDEDDQDDTGDDQDDDSDDGEGGPPWGWPPWG